jgi:hypothetical protein
MRRYFLAPCIFLPLACGGVVDDRGTAPAGGQGAPAPTGAAPGAPSRGAAPETRDHDARFVGTWVVAQPDHALYEETFYTFAADGALRTGSSFPAGCTGHLSQHCVTGSVANCVATPERGCTGTVSCVFGDAWYSAGASTLYVVGRCSDGTPRDIRLSFETDASANATGGAEVKLVSVGGDPRWSHDNWAWAFRKCAPGTTEKTCRW